MRRLLALVLLLLIAVPSSSAQRLPAFAEAPAYSPYADVIAQVRDSVVALVEAQGLPGVSVAVGVDGQVVWAEGFGWADVENGVKMWPHTKLRIGSVSKTLTATAIGLLMQQGRLDVDAPVQQYASYFPEKQWPITTRQVAGHLAGIRHYRGNEFASKEYFATVREGLAIFEDDPLLFEPGTRYSYSSYGWNLVSAVIEEAAGVPFLHYMQREVFSPLGLRETVAEHPDSLIAHRARYYVRGRDGRLVNAPYVDNSYKWAGGGYIGTPSDLVRFGFAYLDGHLLTRATWAELVRPMTLADGSSTNYGMGWRTTDFEGHTFVGHSGGSMGANTMFVIHPEAGVVVAIIANTSNAGVGGIALRIGQLFADAVR